MDPSPFTLHKMWSVILIIPCLLELKVTIMALLYIDLLSLLCELGLLMYWNVIGDPIWMIMIGLVLYTSHIFIALVLRASIRKPTLKSYQMAFVNLWLLIRNLNLIFTLTILILVLCHVISFGTKSQVQWFVEISGLACTSLMLMENIFIVVCSRRMHQLWQDEMEIQAVSDGGGGFGLSRFSLGDSFTGSDSTGFHEGGSEKVLDLRFPGGRAEKVHRGTLEKIEETFNEDTKVWEVKENWGRSDSEKKESREVEVSEALDESDRSKSTKDVVL